MKSHLISVNDYYGFLKNLQSKVYTYKENFIISDGIFQIAGNEEFFWMIEIVYKNQKLLQNASFQIWIFHKENNSTLKVTIQNKSEIELLTFKIENINFEYMEMSLFVADNLLFLPSENKYLIH
jgi:hypothetical protein